MSNYKLARIRPSSFVDKVSAYGGKAVIEIGGSTYQGGETTLPNFGGLSRSVGWFRLPAAVADKIAATFGSAVVDCMTQEEAIVLESKETIAALQSEIEGLRTTVAKCITHDDAVAAIAKVTAPRPLTLTVDGVRMASVLSPKPSGYIITGDTKGTTTVMCSMIVTGDTVLISAPTADDMQALTLACCNAEHHPSIIIDGKNPPVFARIVTVECKHLDGLGTAECVLTLKRSTAAL